MTNLGGYKQYDKQYLMSFEPNIEYNHNVASQILCAQIYYIFIFSDITDIVCF